MEKYLLEKSLYFYMKRLQGERERNVYLRLMDGILNFKEVILIDEVISNERIATIMEYIQKDRPDIFWIDGGCSLTREGELVLDITPSYMHSRIDAEKMMQAMVKSKYYKELDQLLSKKESSFEKALAAYEYIIQHTEYEVNAIGKTSGYYREYAHDIHGVILKERAVCSGYSKTYQYFLTRHGVPCTVVSGVAQGGRHQWNLVNLGGEYYYIDTTWGDPVFSGGEKKDPDYISYDYFCITTEELEQSHQPIFDEKMPLCTATTCNYYRMFDLVEDAYSMQRVGTHILSARRRKKKEAIIKYSNRTAYRLAVQKLFMDKEIHKVFQLVEFTGEKFKGGKVSYNLNDEFYTIRINVE